MSPPDGQTQKRFRTNATKNEQINFKASRPKLTEFTIECLKHTKKDLTGSKYVPVHSCYVYLFYGRGQGNKRIYVEDRLTFELNEAKDRKYVTIDDDGKCDTKLVLGSTYFCYFAGRELKQKEIDALRTTNRAPLIQLIAQPKVQINQSFFWWIALLQRVEKDIQKKGGDSRAVLTKVRKLYYDDDNWNRLIDRESVPALWTWNKAGDKRFVNKSGVSRAVLFALGRAYKMDGDTFIVDKDGDRKITDRHDYVILADGNEIMIGHVLTGLETGYFSPSFLGNWKFGYPKSAATWGGDLGQAVTMALTAKQDGYYQTVGGEKVSVSQALDVVAYWGNSRDAYARKVEMLGDLHGYFMAIKKPLAVNGKSRDLSATLEYWFHKPTMPKTIALWFENHVLKSNNAAKEIADFADVWDDKSELADFEHDDSDHQRLVGVAVEYLRECVKEMKN